MNDFNAEVELAKIEKDYEYLREKYQELHSYNKELSANIKKIEEDLLDLYHLLDSSKCEASHCQTGVHSKLTELQKELESVKRTIDQIRIKTEKSLIGRLFSEITVGSKAISIIFKIVKFAAFILFGILSAKGLISMEFFGLWK